MNIQPISASNQIQNKQKVAFKGYTTSLTEEGIVAAIKKINEDFPSPLMTEDGVKTLSAKLLGNLDQLRQKYKDNKLVDVNTFLDGNNIWGLVKPSKEVMSTQFLSGFGQGQFKPFSEFIISYGGNLVREINEYAKVLEERFKGTIS